LCACTLFFGAMAKTVKGLLEGVGNER